MTRTAQAAFAEHLAEIERLRAELDRKLEALKADHAASPTRWDNVGEAARIADDLRALVGEGE